MELEIIPSTGLTVVVPHDNPTLDIVFVHGFTGHPERTWRHKRGDSRQSGDDNDETSEPPSKAPRFNPFSTAHRSGGRSNSGVYWPRDLLPATVPNARVLTYGYDTHIRHWTGQPVNRNTVRDIAWDFLVALEAGRREEPTRPLLFIVHSLGGIVVKELLRRSSGCRQGQVHLRDVFDSTTGIMFFGTPHGGADPRGILQHAAELVIKAVGFKVNEQIVNALLPSSERLRELRDEFSPMAHEQQWVIHSFQEQLAVKALNGRKVVEDTSSYLNFPAIEITEHIAQNHMDMCRFSGPEDVEYRKVADALRRMTANLLEARISHTSPSLTKEHRQQLRDSLGFDQIDARHATIKRAHAKTCKWLKKKNEYLDWLDPSKIAEHHGFLWIKGNPGTGKSTLMKFAFDQARRATKDKVILSFFFNARGEELEQSTSGMYRSLLLQLLRHIPELETIFDSLPLTVWAQGGGQIQWSIEFLKDLLEQAVQNLGRSWVVCFIDALDECEEDQVRDMVSFFEHIGALAIASNIRFQVCFSSRHYPYITIARGVELVLEGQEGHKQDIVDYVHSELKIGHNSAAEKIRAELQAKASGVFMWVVLVVDILNKEYDRGRGHTLGKRLREIPHRLHDLFRDILTRDARDRDELILCIQWVLFAKQPLKPEELYFAVLAGTDHESLAPWDRELTTPASIQRFIIDSSKGLAETTKSKNPVVQFIHESVRDFLLKDNGLRQIWPDLGDQLQGRSHERLKECCLKCICTDIAAPLCLPEPLPKASSKDAAAIRDLVQQSFPFLKYAIRGVLYHADEAESEGVAQNHFLHEFPVREWIYLHNLLEKYEARHHTPDAGLLSQAAEDGFLALSKLLIKRGVDKEADDNAKRTPLYRAAWNGNLAIVELLIEAGADKETRDRDGRTPLSRAAGKGHLEVVKLLIKVGANIEVKDREGQTPLFWASCNMNPQAAKLLIELGANIEAGDRNVKTPLHSAAFRNHLAAITFLVDEGANIEAEDKDGRTPLHLAASHYYTMGAMKQLIKAGANIEAKDRHGLTPLSLASYSGNAQSTKLLVEEGANVDAEDKSGRTPLMRTASNHVTVDTMKQLIKAGANIEAKDMDGRTPLSWAASNEFPPGYLGLELLIDAGADIETKDMNGRTPLYWAVYSNCLNNIRRLIEAGADKEARGIDGQTPLSLAAIGGHSDIVKLLRP